VTRRDTPTTPAGCPDDRAHDCAADGWTLDAVGYQPPRTVPMAPPDPVAAYVAKRAAIVALRAECDALWDAMGESDHDRVVTTLEALGLVG